MKPRIDIDICDYEGKAAELRDPSTFEPFEIYLNDERLITSERVEEIEEENAKLRDLVRDMWTCVREGEWDCSDCPRYAGCCDGASEFRDRMRELKIEVDE